MTITAVIAEYNPFHNGHAYQLAKARELTGPGRKIGMKELWLDFSRRGTLVREKLGVAENGSVDANEPVYNNVPSFLIHRSCLWQTGV